MRRWPLEMSVAALVLLGSLRAQASPPADAPLADAPLAQQQEQRSRMPADAPLANPINPHCQDCEVRPRPWTALGELMLTQALPSSFNIILRDAEWARINAASWAANLENPWQWDNNAFLNNQFSHPYHGSLYYNSARANGYDFWRSAPWAFGGSLMWELFGERWAPSPNDLWNTSLGGITLGETLWRVSSLVLDNEATGSERVMREIGAALINPVRGFNRLVDGHAWREGPNPPGFRPKRIMGLLDLGYGRSDGETLPGDSVKVDAAFLAGELLYGDPVSDLAGVPFSTFDGRLWLMSKQEEGARRFSLLQARGSLHAWRLSHGGEDGAQHFLATYITYDYFSTPSLDYGGQGFAVGPVSRWGAMGPVRFETELLATPMPIAAVRSDYFVTEEGRDYDYGIGMGGRAEMRLLFAGRARLKAAGRYLWEPILSGYNGNHQQLSLDVEARFFVIGQVGLGAAATWYRRNSQYDAFPDVNRTGREIRVFASLAGPRWTP
ncbi:DUF3943 domain-containing protein [Aggregicoccus sp. 17bor-14]|uniref:DUF3943 domain-containing protein n=1 Tax=Myxococcaceae TaxID=31 RepID=UPI00129CA15C|nr:MULTISPECIES: DUF3943 domain-containing protein [Myxococcaceae]MBF5043113.1 DUF3943 domain-containing protein [Simulacricoccus sp. 17bor-14]MRI88875.1 DUF3943 domain-containing protein [Aggregicoccus sp. 17bor-14]